MLTSINTHIHLLLFFIHRAKPLALTRQWQCKDSALHSAVSVVTPFIFVLHGTYFISRFVLKIPFLFQNYNFFFKIVVLFVILSIVLFCCKKEKCMLLLVRSVCYSFLGIIFFFFLFPISPWNVPRDNWIVFKWKKNAVIEREERELLVLFFLLFLDLFSCHVSFVNWLFVFIYLLLKKVGNLLLHDLTLLWECFHFNVLSFLYI